MHVGKKFSLRTPPDASPITLQLRVQDNKMLQLTRDQFRQFRTQGKVYISEQYLVLFMKHHVVNDNSQFRIVNKKND